MNRKGFTLTEILIVLVVAGILLALILPNTLKAIERANVTGHRSNLNTIQVALFMCFTETRDWDACADLDALVAGDYLDSEFTSNANIHPFGGSYGVIDDPDGSAGKVACTSGGDNIPADITDDESIVECT